MYFKTLFNVIVGSVLFALPFCTKGEVDSVLQGISKLYPNYQIKKSTHLLNESQRKTVEERSGTPLSTSLIFAYALFEGSNHVGTVYLDKHRVRTLPATLLLEVSPKGQIADIQVLQFKEPEEYEPPERWLDQFYHHALDDELQLYREIDGMTGATLTARSTTYAVRRTLALHQLLFSDH